MSGVVVQNVASRPTVVVIAETTWQQFPLLWPEMLDEVWSCLRAGGIYRGCRNSMYYRDQVPNVEVGVVLDRPVPLIGRVVTSSLPAGQVATAIHRGPYSGLAATHQAVLDWCTVQRRRPTGQRWEIYGPHSDDEDQLRTEVSWLLV